MREAMSPRISLVKREAPEAQSGECAEGATRLRAVLAARGTCEHRAHGKRIYDTL